MANTKNWRGQFTAEGFDAEAICQLTLAAGMKYITFTTRHHDGFCLFQTAQGRFFIRSTRHVGRDLLGELAAACQKHELGLFLYYSYAVDWRHPYFFPRDELASFARPAYDFAEPRYLFRKDEDFGHYNRLRSRPTGANF